MLFRRDGGALRPASYLHNNAAAIEVVGQDFEITTQDLDVWERTMRTT